MNEWVNYKCRILDKNLVIFVLSHDKGVKGGKNWMLFAAHFTINGRESIVFGQIFEMEILMNLHILRSPESEKHIFSVWSLCVCVSVCQLSA